MLIANVAINVRAIIASAWPTNATAKIVIAPIVRRKTVPAKTVTAAKVHARDVKANAARSKSHTLTTL